MYSKPKYNGDCGFIQEIFLVKVNPINSNSRYNEHGGDLNVLPTQKKLNYFIQSINYEINLCTR